MHPHIRSNQLGHPHAAITPSATYSPWYNDVLFMATFQRIQGLTLVDIYRCWELWTLLRQSRHVPGDIIEIGVWRGGTAAILGRARDVFAGDKQLYLCDTFSGMVKTSDKDEHYTGGEHSETNTLLVQGALTLADVDDAHILEGIFPDETGHFIPEEGRFAFCHIDVDVYESAKDVLEYLWPRVSPNGIVVFDDFGFETCSGIAALVEEYRNASDRLTIHNLNGHAIFVKR
jgi:O-methyltransferase